MELKLFWLGMILFVVVACAAYGGDVVYAELPEGWADPWVGNDYIFNATLPDMLYTTCYTLTADATGAYDLAEAQAADFVYIKWSEPVRPDVAPAYVIAGTWTSGNGTRRVLNLYRAPNTRQDHEGLRYHTHWIPGARLPQSSKIQSATISLAIVRTMDGLGREGTVFAFERR